MLYVYSYMMLGLLTFACLSYSVFGNALQEEDDDDGDGVYDDDSIGLTNAEDDDGDGVYDDDSVGLINAVTTVVPKTTEEPATTSQEPELTGWCLSSSGEDQNSGVQSLKTGSKAECYRQCKAVPEATGCEWHKNGACIYHTLDVATGSGSNDWRCWVLNPTSKVTTVAPKTTEEPTTTSQVTTVVPKATEEPATTSQGLENWQNCLIPNTASLPYSNYNAGSSASPSDYQLKCQQDTSCQWFNFIPSDGCWLLQYAKKGETSTSSTIGWVTGPKTCSLENCQTCLIPNTASLPYSNYTAGLSPSPSDCQLKCQEDTSCQWFNFIPSDGCWLLQYAKTGESSTSSTIGWVTGPKSCSLKNCQNCLIPNTASLPYSNYKAGLTPSPSDCQLKCQEDTSCQWFNFIPSNGCWLLQYAKTGETSTSSTIGWVTGPKTCSVDDRVEVSATTSN